MFRILILLLLPSFAMAQNEKSTSGYLIFLLGKDTTGAGFYQLKGNEFNMEVVSRPNVSITRMKGSLFNNGEIASAEGYAFRPVPGKDSQLLVTYKLYVKGDSTFIETQQTGRAVNTSRFPGRGMITNSVGASFRYFLGFWGMYAPPKTGDSLVSGHLVFSSNRPFVMKRIAENKIYAGSGVMGMHTLYVDKKGHLLSVDGIGSSWNETAVVVDKLDLKELAERYAIQEQSGTGLKAINQLDSVQATVNNTSVKIIYSRPQVRGRKIFGNVVPWDRWWRTGANSSTKLIIDKPIQFGEKELAAGAYSVWTIPSQKGWTMMINSQSNVWGTEYNPAFDVLRIPMKSESLKDPVELMSIELSSSGPIGVISVSWEKVKATVGFVVKGG